MLTQFIFHVWVRKSGLRSRPVSCLLNIWGKIPLFTFSSRNRSAMQTAFCPAEGVIALPAPLHPQNRLRLSFFNIVAYIANHYIHTSETYSSGVPGKGELEGEKWASQLRTPFPLVTLPTQQCPPERKVQFMPAASRLSRRETFIYASVSSRNCGIGVTGGIGGSSKSPDIFR